MQAIDKHGADIFNSVIVTVTGVNDAPTMDAGVLDAAEDGATVSLSLAALGDDVDSDNDGGNLVYTLVAPAGPGGGGKDPNAETKSDPLPPPVSAGGSAWIDGTTLNFAPGGDFQQLALGETSVQVLHVKATDVHGASTVNTVTVTTTGVNDAPTLGSLGLGTAEDGMPASFDLALLGDDVDSDDDGGTLVYTLQGPPPPEGTAVISGTTLTFDPQAGYQSLAAGEIKSFDLQLQAKDKHGATADTLVNISVTGINDAPVITDADASGAVTAHPVAFVPPSTTLTDAGFVKFGDVDLSDSHTLTVNTLGLPLGTFTASVGKDTTGSGTGGVLVWNYAIGNTLAAYLGADESITNSYLLTVDDGKGGTAQQQVDVKLSGVNDAPVITSGTDQAQGNTMEDTTLSASGQVTISDLDNTDTHTWSISSPTSGAYGAASVDSKGKWTYTVANGTNGVASPVQSLQQGETVIETFTVRASDGKGGNADQIVHVVVAGINDAAVISSQSLTLTETNAPQSTGGTLTVTDIDNLAAFNAQGGAGKYGNFAIGADGTWTYAMNGAHNEFELGKNYVETFNVVAVDGTTKVSAVTVTIAGTNDAPTAVNDLGALTVTSLASQVNTTTVKWVDWTSMTPGNVKGFIDLGGGQKIDVTFSGASSTAGVNNYYTTPPAQPGDLSLGTGTYTSAGVSNGPTGTDIVILHAATTRTLTFSQPVDDLFFAVVSLNGNGYRFDQDFDILSYGRGFFGAGSAVKTALPDGRFELLSVNTPGKNELHGVIGIKGSVTSLTWDGLTDEYWNGFTVGTYGKAQTAVATGNLLGNDTDPENNPLIVSTVNGQTIAGSSTTQTLASGARLNVNKNGNYNYDENGAFAKLGANETFVDTFTYIAQDSPGASSNVATATITVTGINDAPTFTGGDASGAVTVVPGSAPFKLEQFTNYFGSFDDASLHAFAAANKANHTVFTTVIDYTDDPAGFAGEIVGSSRWPADPTGAQGTEGINNHFFARITGQVSVSTTDTYTFRTFNDDGVYLRVNNQLIISDSGIHPEQAYQGSITLSPGVYPIELFFYENGGEASLELTYKNATSVYGHVASGAFDSGVLTFSDVDLTDGHTAIVTPVGSTLGVLTTSVTKDTTGSGTGGEVKWNYQLDSQPAAYLGAGATKVDTFTVTVNDGKGGTAQQSVSVTVTGANDLPVAVADTASTNEEAAVTINVLGNDTDVDVGDTKALISASNGTNGTVTIVGNNAVYTPALNFTGNDSFTYMMKDAAGATSSATVNVTVNPVNDGPTIKYVSATVTNGSFEQPGGGNGYFTTGSTGMAGWTVIGADVDYINSQWPSADGTHNLDLNGFNGGGVKQTLTTVPGQTYTLGFQLSQNPGASNSTVRVTAAGTTKDYFFYADSTEANMLWTGQTFTFTATSTSTDLSFASLNGGAQGPALDNVVALATKENTSLTIQGLSVADGDAGTNPVNITLSVTNGAVALSSVAGLLALDSNGSDGSISYAGPQAAINAALASGVIYSPTANYSGSATLTAVINDAGHTGIGGALSATQLVPIQVYDVTLPQPISFWLADGNANDNIAPLNNGTLVNGLGFIAGRNGGQAFNFDGVDDYVSIERELTNDFTVFGWMKTTQVAPSGSQFFHGDGLVYADVGGVNNDFGISQVGTKIAFGTGNPDTSILSTSNVNTGNWVQFAAVRNGSTLSLWINGVLENTINTGNSGALATPPNIIFGANVIDGRYFQGQMDDVQFFDHALTPMEIIGVMNVNPV